MKKPITVTFEMLQMRFDKPLCDVAHELGVCLTFIKKTCRQHGIMRWPFRKVRPCPPLFAGVTSDADVNVLAIVDVQRQSLL